MKKCIVCGSSISEEQIQRFGGYCSEKCEQEAPERIEKFKKVLRGEKPLNWDGKE